jgi:hypothetical protein
VQPGTWNVAVRVDNENTFKYGETDVKVEKGGQSAIASITLISPTPFTNWDELGSSITGSDGEDQVFLIPSNLTVTRSIELKSGRNITLLARENIIIEKGDFPNSLFRVISGSKLTLSRIDEGTITIIGNRVDKNASLCYVGTDSHSFTAEDITGGTLIMNDGVFLTNNHADNDSRGGAVVVENGTFIMKGGEISGNTGTFAGGVLILSGIFNQTGGKIYGSGEGSNSNKARDNGGGNAVAVGSVTVDNATGKVTSYSITKVKRTTSESLSTQSSDGWETP